MICIVLSKALALVFSGCSRFVNSERFKGPLFLTLKTMQTMTHRRRKNMIWIDVDCFGVAFDEFHDETPHFEDEQTLLPMSNQFAMQSSR